MSNEEKPLRMILKFDTGADGFRAMMFVLAWTAVAVLLAGIYFLVFVFGGMLP